MSRDASGRGTSARTLGGLGALSLLFALERLANGALASPAGAGLAWTFSLVFAVAGVALVSAGLGMRGGAQVSNASTRRPDGQDATRTHE